MNIKTYQSWRMALGMIIGAVVAVSVIIGNIYVLISAVLAGMIVVVILRRRVTGVITDERTYAIAYKAARLTMAVTGVGMALAGAILIALNRDNLSSAPAQIGFVLEYVTGGLLLINLAAYTYYNRKLGGGNE